MSDGHANLGPELRQLAQAILDRLDPAVRAAAAMVGEGMRGSGRCQQVWCPVCALAALINGEQHPMLTVIAEHSVALMSVIQAMAATGSDDGPGESGTGTGTDTDTDTDPPRDADDDAEEVPPPSSSVRFHHIPIVVEGGNDHDVDV